MAADSPVVMQWLRPRLALAKDPLRRRGRFNARGWDGRPPIQLGLALARAFTRCLSRSDLRQSAERQPALGATSRSSRVANARELLQLRLPQRSDSGRKN
jgi:hypothetical protein